MSTQRQAPAVRRDSDPAIGTQSRIGILPHSVNPWAPYTPSERSPWNLRRLVHLHRRAGFAATWGELQRDLKDGPAASIDRLLAGKTRRDGVPDDFASVADTLLRHASDTDRLKAWWIYRMLCGPDR